jgi:small subunit ribosomal protein S20
MAHSNSARKRIRQNAKTRAHNRSKKSALRSQLKKVRQAIAEGDVVRAREEYRLAMKRADKTAKTNAIHRNQAARMKSRLARAINALG